MNSKLDLFLDKTTTVSVEDKTSDLGITVLIAKASVPFSHRRIADKYVILKNMCTFQVVQPRITKVEANLLSKYMFSTLENTTISKANQELIKLKEWAISTNDELREDSEEIFKIRVKELKFMLSNNYTSNSNEMMNGYKAIETYLINIGM
jgi:hypothetical protein